ncbi:MAG: SDR family NAD(P)-dependent oxidoreductase, partial [Clostridia bacterium]|nr:SDR family NAD(P)-dependent oxidoreductase [Clostridia bacterium]
MTIVPGKVSMPEQGVKEVKVRDLFDLRDRVAIITGGSIGLGRQMAEALADAGANVVLAARKVERCEEAAQEIAREYGTKAIPFRCDVANPDEVRALVEGTV